MLVCKLKWLFISFSSAIYASDNVSYKSLYFADFAVKLSAWAPYWRPALASTGAAPFEFAPLILCLCENLQLLAAMTG